MLQLQDYCVRVKTENGTTVDYKCRSSNRAKVVRTLATKYPDVFDHAVKIEFVLSDEELRQMLIQHIYTQYGRRSYTEELGEQVEQEIEEFLLQQAMLGRDVTNFYVSKIAVDRKDWSLIFPLVDK